MCSNRCHDVPGSRSSHPQILPPSSTPQVERIAPLTMKHAGNPIMSPQYLMRWYTSQASRPVPVLVQVTGLLFALQYFGLLVPLARFVLLAVMLTAGGVALFQCGRIALRSRAPEYPWQETFGSTHVALLGASSAAAVLAGVRYTGIRVRDARL